VTTQHVKSIDLSNRAMGPEQVCGVVSAFANVETPVEQWNLRANGLNGPSLATSLNSLRYVSRGGAQLAF